MFRGIWFKKLKTVFEANFLHFLAARDQFGYQRLLGAGLFLTSDNLRRLSHISDNYVTSAPVYLVAGY